MIFLNTLWLIINLLLILLILVRSPNEQSLQERLGPLKLFDSYGSTEKNLDKIIKFFNFQLFFYWFSFNIKCLKKVEMPFYTKEEKTIKIIKSELKLDYGKKENLF